MLAVFHAVSRWQVAGKNRMERRPWTTPKRKRGERSLPDLTYLGGSCLCIDVVLSYIRSGFKHAFDSLVSLGYTLSSQRGITSYYLSARLH